VEQNHRNRFDRQDGILYGQRELVLRRQVFVGVSGATLTNYRCHWDVGTERKTSYITDW